MCSPNNKSFKYPIVSLTMKGGEKFLVNDPVLVISMDVRPCYLFLSPPFSGLVTKLNFLCNLTSITCLSIYAKVSFDFQSGDIYCLGVVKSEDVNIIGRKYINMTTMICV